MDINDYNKIIVDLIDFEIEMSSIAESRKTILKLQEKREILINMKEQIRGDIRSTEVQYLSMRTSIREEFSIENVDNSRKRKLLKGNKSPATMRAKAMKKLEAKKKGKIESYNDIKITIDDLLEQVDAVMIEVYGSMKSFLGNSY
ncbi:MAG: hypothetical protein Q7U35_00990 [Methanobacteriaceae archaeon]|nr:hypothetical protein [Methanobacteriaceae archaeon]MDP3035143.1 hypothetical protein [Methanobacteriaceae archaeon]MDP3485448.1 hypothetical protein [Methanobacteriaceae archaeon]